MEIIAILFLICCVMRIILWWFDDGFGGGVWNTIMYTSSIAWILGIVLALNVLWSLPAIITIKVG